MCGYSRLSFCRYGRDYRAEMVATRREYRSELEEVS